MNALICFFLFTYGLYALFNNFKFWIIYLLLIGVYYYLTQVKYFQTYFSSIRRKIIVAIWGPNNDPQIYAKVKLDITKMEYYLAEKSIETGEKITLTLFAIKLMSIILKKYPRVYSYINFGKEGVDICCLVQVGEGTDLTNTVIRNSETKDFKNITEELKESVAKFRKKKNEMHNKRMNILNYLPTFLIGPIMQCTSFLSSIGIEVNFLGLKKFEFGSCVLSSIGSLGVENAYAPIPPLSFCPLLVSVCKKKTTNYYNADREIKERVTLAMNFTIDSRFIDARDAEGINRDLKLIGENPEIFEKEMNSFLKPQAKSQESNEKKIKKLY